MGKRSRIRQRVAAAANPQRMTGHAIFGGSSGFIATQESPARGRMVLFGEDTKKQLSPLARTVLILKSRTLVENFGPAKAIWNLAELIGSLKPQARSGDPKWDALAEARFDQIANSPLAFDRAGRRTFYTYQTFATFRRYVDGDFFSFLTETTTGGAAVAGRESHLCRGGEGDGWYDGVLTDANGFALRYNFRSMEGGKDYVVDRAKIHHHATFGTGDATRGTPALAHAINNFHDILETTGFVKRAIKTAALMGITRRQDASSNGTPPSLYGMGASTSTDVFSAPGCTTSTEKSVTIEDVFDAGLLSSVPLDTLHDDRPHPNSEEFQKRLLREAALGLGVPPQILFFMDSPGGAEIRTHLDIFDRFIKAQHQNYLIPFCQRFWTYCIAKEIKSGRLPEPDGEFWKVRWSPPKSITADIGKMGALTIQLRKAGLMTDADHYEAMGKDYESELEQVAKEQRLRADLADKYKIDPATMAIQ